MELAPRVENTETQEGWGRLWAVGILDQTPDPHPCPVLLSKSLSLRYPPLLPAPPPRCSLHSTAPSPSVETTVLHKALLKCHLPSKTLPDTLGDSVLPSH